MTVTIFSPTVCALGEGPLWHPLRGQLFWFDILAKKLLTRTEAGEERYWQFDAHVSAAGWVDRDTLVIADEAGLLRFDIESGAQSRLAEIEADQPLTRSNDGRADPWGGFWIGTMGKKAEPGLGAIYRYYRGEVRRLVADVTISNSIAFSPDRVWAYYTDTRVGRIMRQKLDPREGWPVGEPDLFIDLSGTTFGADGSVVDSAGCLWNAQWGAGRVARYAPDGTLLSVVEVPTPQVSCPAFGGADLKTLYITTAATGIDTAPAGATFRVRVDTPGQAEHRVLL
ncbi:SMP-30/gluconolactonase/LRE family protein [Defluviimonas aestuarii]|uniref:SMP-30/gluconolactonase/LRE family protein n=1 Tax=Albidovulum aestuarii TaxID=1130726 RepID=UPI00249AD160|nr:SMP-30/gluconolactonase/LRE family protein [Defluviimonas aestuarii]MDI3337639.1 SMP-30/gluconolactonase/LRE family protein [Defluviimonas aestuarii]